MRPLSTIGTALSRWARNGGVQATVQYSGRFRATVDNIGCALNWMSRGYQYDNRTFFQRMTDKNARYFWRMAVKTATN